MRLMEFLDKYQVNEKLITYCIASGLRQLIEEDSELSEEMLERFSIENEETIETMIDDIDTVSWHR